MRIVCEGFYFQVNALLFEKIQLVYGKDDCIELKVLCYLQSSVTFELCSDTSQNMHQRIMHQIEEIPKK